MLLFNRFLSIFFPIPSHSIGEAVKLAYVDQSRNDLDPNKSRRDQLARYGLSRKHSQQQSHLLDFSKWE
ncbi:MAG: hypothetical protein A2035_06625 [Nitrospirae bacterium GWA2_42_11]|nr:MAG: hypothetical protein A2035_06625 [Nitrospirae bacterium GWA2_42_11]